MDKGRMAKPKENDCFRMTEKILYSLDKLKVKVETDKEDIRDMIIEKQNRSALHVLRKPQGPDLDDDIRHRQKVRNRERAMLRTQKLIQRTERCLKQLEQDEWYNVIELIYLQQPGMTIEQVACEIHTSIATVYRQKKRLINELSILFYGADALDV